MEDRELLELAAKAAGLTGEWVKTLGGWDALRADQQSMMDKPWQPLRDDGDALRLAVKLKMDICRPHDQCGFVAVWVDHEIGLIEEPESSDPYAATRRVIVRAAAEIGKTK